MLDTDSFDIWCQSLGIDAAARSAIEHIRSSDPERRVDSRRGNVSGNYLSHKMGVTIQFESHRNELARIYELEHDPDVFEYYDQPPSFELDYKAKSGRRNRHLYTPDFFVIRKDSAGWEECKTEDDLKRLAESSPNRYQKNDAGQWCCPPAENHAHPLGLYFKVWSSAEINWVFQRNFQWLSDYFGLDSSCLDHNVAQEIVQQVKENQGTALSDLLQIYDADTLNMLIAIEEIYVDLYAVQLAEPDRVKVFSDEGTAFAYQRMQESTVTIEKHNQIFNISVGKTVVWDNECWEIVNTGTKSIGLLRNDGKLIELPNTEIERLIGEGKITLSSQPDDDSLQQEILNILKSASSNEIEEANQRYKQIQPFLEPKTSSSPSSTIRRWVKQYREAEEMYGRGYIGLLPKHHAKGNRLEKIDHAVREFMQEFIEKNYETLKHRRVKRVHQSFVEACETSSPPLTPPTQKTFYEEIKKRPRMKQIAKREGRRAALPHRPIYLSLKLETPRHGDRPFEIVHIDHTQLDQELVCSLSSLEQCRLNLTSSKAQNLGRPWATFMVDAYSRRLLAVYLTYENPSYRSCMAVLRICVQRFKRFPQSIVVDNGTEFHSHYFEKLLAFYSCTLKHRPPADARFGYVVERLFGTANTQLIHEMRGNTQIKRLQRKVTKSVKPESQAVWTLPDLHDALCEWAYEVYDQRQHPTLGQSPREAFNTGLALGGNRTHCRVEYDEIFYILTLPAPKRGSRKIHPGHGFSVNYIYYWSNLFRDPGIEKSCVDVRYDPFNVGIAYAFIKGQWTKCISNNYQYFNGRSEVEIRLISTELRKRKRDLGRDTVVSDKDLVRFLSSKEAQEEKFLLARLQASENQAVIQRIAPEQVEISSHQIVSSSLDEDLEVLVESAGLEELDSDDEDLSAESSDENVEDTLPNEDNNPYDFDYYGEW
jgi:hypothetical protein